MFLLNHKTLILILWKFPKFYFFHIFFPLSSKLLHVFLICHSNFSWSDWHTSTSIPNWLLAFMLTSFWIDATSSFILHHHLLLPSFVNCHQDEMIWRLISRSILTFPRSSDNDKKCNNKTFKLWWIQTQTTVFENSFQH